MVSADMLYTDRQAYQTDRHLMQCDLAKRRRGRHLSIGNSHDHFCTILGNAPSFILAPHHEPHDVLEEDQGGPPLGTELYEVSTCMRGRLQPRSNLCALLHHSDPCYIAMALITL